MPVTVTCDSSCDAHVTGSRAAISTYLNRAGNNVNPNTGDTFDQAFLVGTGHYSTSAWDPTNANHITVQMTNATLRSQGRFQILHWRPSGPNAWAPTTTDAAAHAKKKNDRRLKKQRARLNAAARQQGGGTQPGSSSSSGPAAAPAAPRPAAPQSSLAFVPRNVAQRPAVPANNPAAPRPAAGPANPAAPRPAAGPANPAAPRPAGSQSSLAFVPRNVAKKAAAKKSSTSGS